MANLQYAKESIVLEALKLVAENDKRTQSLELGGSVVFKAKSVALGQSLADALHANTKLTALNLSSCNLSDSAIEKLSAPLSHNTTLYDLNLADNKIGRPGLTAIARALMTNKGLITLNLLGHRVNSEVCAAFVNAFTVNLTLLKLIWKVDVGGYTLKFTEMTNRNVEIEICSQWSEDCHGGLCRAMDSGRRGLACVESRRWTYPAIGAGGHRTAVDVWIMCRQQIALTV